MLQEVVSSGQFEDYYRLNNLHTIDNKISNLKETMKIRAMLCDEEETPEEILAGLEESVLLGYWKASW
jgi:hypothetical protein